MCVANSTTKHSCLIARIFFKIPAKWKRSHTHVDCNEQKFPLLMRIIMSYYNFFYVKHQSPNADMSEVFCVWLHTSVGDWQIDILRRHVSLVLALRRFFSCVCVAGKESQENDEKFIGHNPIFYGSYQLLRSIFSDRNKRPWLSILWSSK